jgi:uncharacterized protein (TIGR00369 family)
VKLDRLLAGAERRSPKLAQVAKKWFAQYAVPMNRALGLRIEEVASDSSRVVLRLPARRRNLNIGGTVHGAAIFALAETVHGIAFFWQFAPAQYSMVTRQARLEFLTPARGALTCSFALEEAVRCRIADELARQGACEVEFTSEVQDAQGRTVARLLAAYAIRRLPRVSPEGGPTAARGRRAGGA